MLNNNGLLYFSYLICLVFPMRAFPNDVSDPGCVGNTYEQHQCLDKQQKIADKVLEDTYNSLVKYSYVSTTELQQAQERWKEFRKANCAYYASYLSGGTGELLVQSYCWLRMTKERGAELKKEYTERVGR